MAHGTRNAVSGVYRPSDLFDKRIVLIASWAARCAAPPAAVKPICAGASDVLLDFEVVAWSTPQGLPRAITIEEQGRVRQRHRQRQPKSIGASGARLRNDSEKCAINKTSACNHFQFHWFRPVTESRPPSDCCS